MNLFTQAVWYGSYWAVHVPREVTLIARANGKSACAFDTCLASHSKVFLCDLFCLPKTFTCEKYDQTRLWSVCTSSQLVWYIYIVHVDLWRRLKDAYVKRK